MSNAGSELPDAPYVAVIFTSQRTDGDHDAYASMADRMAQLAAEQPGYLGIDSARDPNGAGVTVSYWSSEEDAVAWKQVAEHLGAQRLGQQRWYEWYTTRIAVVGRQYAWKQAGS